MNALAHAASAAALLRADTAASTVRVGDRGALPPLSCDTFG